jgi:hypothetical protein
MAQLHLGGPAGTGGQRPALALEREVEQHVQLVGGRDQVVGGLELAAQLAERDDHEVDHQLGRHQLPHGELALHHQPTAETQQRGAGQHLQPQRAEVLPEDDPEVRLARAEPRRGETVQAPLREVATATELEEVALDGHVLEPGRDRILGLGLADGRARGASPHDAQHHEETCDDQPTEAQQHGVVDRQEHQPRHHRQHGLDAPEGQRRDGLLRHEHVEEAVHQL